MRRWAVYLGAFLIIAFWGVAPFRGTDVAKLSPVEVIRVSSKEGRIRIETDTGDIGIGGTIESALANLKATTPGTVFLETADFLIVAANEEGLIELVSPYLRPACSICVENGKVDMEKAAAFLNAHEPIVTIQDWHSGEKQIPTLKVNKGRMVLVQ